MITLIRWILLKQKEIKWKSAFWQFIDKQAAELIRDPETFEKKIFSGIADIIYENSGLHKDSEDAFNKADQKINP